jgi:hypothetical protein
VTRVYYPTTLDDLAAQVATGELRGLEGVLADSEGEEDEYAALVQAAADSQALLPGGGRRVVVVAELADTEDPDAPVPLRRLVAVHADPADRPAGADPDEDLGWYAVQELDTLLAGR